MYPSWSCAHFGVGIVLYCFFLFFLGDGLVSHTPFSSVSCSLEHCCIDCCQDDMPDLASLWVKSLQRLLLYMTPPAVQASSDSGRASHAAVPSAQKQELFPVNKSVQALLLCRLSTTRCTSSSTQAYRPARTAAKGPFSRQPFLRSAAPFRSWRYARLVSQPVVHRSNAATP